jgi:PDZ domain-containing secreted protein
MMYDFNEQIKGQQEYFNQFIEWLKKRKSIIEVNIASKEEDKKGTDLFVKTENGDTFRVQVKVDHKADNTGNIVFETISQAYANKNSVIGAEFNMADVDYIFFILSKSGRILGYKFALLLEFVIDNYKTFENFQADNFGYKTLGVKVPVSQIKHLITHKGNLSEASIV